MGVESGDAEVGVALEVGRLPRPRREERGGGVLRLYRLTHDEEDARKEDRACHAVRGAAGTGVQCVRV